MQPHPHPTPPRNPIQRNLVHLVTRQILLTTPAHIPPNIPHHIQTSLSVLPPQVLHQILQNLRRQRHHLLRLVAKTQHLYLLQRVPSQRQRQVIHAIRSPRQRYKRLVGLPQGYRVDVLVRRVEVGVLAADVIIPRFALRDRLRFWDFLRSPGDNLHLQRHPCNVGYLKRRIGRSKE